MLADRAELVKELADELAADGQQALAVTADLEHWEGANSVVQQALSAFGRIDVLINNVGGAINFKPFTQFTDSEIRAEIDRSLMTTLYACRAALPTMVDRGAGVIVNVSSAATRGIHRIPYSAAKGGDQRHHRVVGNGVRRCRHSRGGYRARGHRGAPATDLARYSGTARRDRASLVRRPYRPNHRVIVAQAIRNTRRAGRGDLLSGLRRGVLHHRHCAAGRRRRPRLTGSLGQIPSDGGVTIPPVASLAPGACGVRRP